MARARFGLFGVNEIAVVTSRADSGATAAQSVTAFAQLDAGGAIRPRKMTICGKNGSNLRPAAQNRVTSWCQSRDSCDKKLCLHYEMREIHDFGSKSCSSWIHSSHTAPRFRVSDWSRNTLALWTNLVQLFRSVLPRQ